MSGKRRTDEEILKARHQAEMRTLESQITRFEQTLNERSSSYRAKMIVPKQARLAQLRTRYSN